MARPPAFRPQNLVDVPVEEQTQNTAPAAPVDIKVKRQNAFDQAADELINKYVAPSGSGISKAGAQQRKAIRGLIVGTDPNEDFITKGRSILNADPKDDNHKIAAAIFVRAQEILENPQSKPVDRNNGEDYVNSAVKKLPQLAAKPANKESAPSAKASSTTGEAQVSNPPPAASAPKPKSTGLIYTPETITLTPAEKIRSEAAATQAFSELVGDQPLTDSQKQRVSDILQKEVKGQNTAGSMRHITLKTLVAVGAESDAYYRALAVQIRQAHLVNVPNSPPISVMAAPSFIQKVREKINTLVMDGKIEYPQVAASEPSAQETSRKHMPSLLDNIVHTTLAPDTAPGTSATASFTPMADSNAPAFINFVLASAATASPALTSETPAAPSAQAIAANELSSPARPAIEPTRPTAAPTTVAYSPAEQTPAMPLRDAAIIQPKPALPQEVKPEPRPEFVVTAPPSAATQQPPRAEVPPTANSAPTRAELTAPVTLAAVEAPPMQRAAAAPATGPTEQPLPFTIPLAPVPSIITATIFGVTESSRAEEPPATKAEPEQPAPAAPAAIAAKPAPTKPTTYVVQKGDTLAGIVQKLQADGALPHLDIPTPNTDKVHYHPQQQERLMLALVLARTNNIENIDHLVVGRELNISTLKQVNNGIAYLGSNILKDDGEVDYYNEVKGKKVSSLIPDVNSPPPPTSYTIKKGDTMLGITHSLRNAGALYTPELAQYDKSTQDFALALILANKNGVEDLDHIRTGKKFILPTAEEIAQNLQEFKTNILKDKKITAAEVNGHKVSEFLSDQISPARTPASAAVDYRTNPKERR